MKIEKLIFEISLSPEQIKQASELLAGLGAAPDDVKSPSMRLVDILARELKVWPEPLGEKVGQCQDGRLHGYAGGGHYSCEVTASEYSMCDGYSKEVVTRAEWLAAVDALNAPKVAEWVKGTLPPIGSVVEWGGRTFSPEEPQEKDLHVGDHVTIIAHLKDGDFELAAFTFNPKIHNPNRGSVWVNQGAYGCFRPIHAAEPAKDKPRPRPYQIAEMREAMHAALIDGSRRMEDNSLAFLIDEGWIDPSSYVLSRWPRQTYGFELSPEFAEQEKAMEQAIIDCLGRDGWIVPMKRGSIHAESDQEAAHDRKECPEFLKSRIESLEAELAQAHEKMKSQPSQVELESRIEDLEKRNKALSEVTVWIDDTGISTLSRAQDGDGLYFTNQEDGIKVIVQRKGD